MAAAHYDMEMGGRYGERKYPLPMSTQHQPYPQQRERERQWVPWVVPLVVSANIVLFAVTMYANNCPAHTTGSH
jgi:hypothetical protein